MSGALIDALNRLPDLLAAHVVLALAALAAGLLVSLPLGVAATWSARTKTVATGLASVVQTIPSLALLALMVPIFAGRIGFAPAFAALTLYSMLPIIRNTIVGLDSVDPAVREAARAVGMTRWQALARIEAPLAAPAIVAGVRTASVWVVGAATLATPVGATSLGDLIFAGLQTRNWTFVIVGCVAAALLALLIDQALGWAEETAQPGPDPKRARRLGATTGGLAVALAALTLSPAVLAPRATTTPTTAQTPAATAQTAGKDAALAGRTLTVGAKTFTEQFILARVIGTRLEAAGASIRYRENMGSAIVFDALASGEIDVYVDYTGTLWTNVLRADAPATRAVMLTETTAQLWRDRGVMLLGALGFENAYAFAMRADQAEALGVRSIADLSGRDLTIGADPEVFARPEWTSARDAYGLEALGQRAMDSTFMYGAARDGQVDVITAYTTDGRIDAFALTLLSDPKAALPPYDAVILLSPQAASDPAIAAALTPLINAIAPQTMRAANARVDLDGRSVEDAAAWLGETIAPPR